MKTHPRSQNPAGHGWIAWALTPFTGGPRAPRPALGRGALLVLITLGITRSTPAGNSPPSTPPPEVSVQRIWNAAPHNAFTDLTRFRGRWFCVFREGSGHVSPDGAVRVLTSRDGGTWESAARLTSTRGDLRDPKVVPAPGGRLMLTAAVAFPMPSAVTHQTLAWFSRNGRDWGDPAPVGEPNLWLWRVTWDRGLAYGIGYDTTAERFVRLYKSANGIDFETLVPRLFDEGYPNETSLLFPRNRDGAAVCLLRRDGDPGTGKVGIARAPYTDWEWKDLGVKIGGPHLLRLADDRIVAAVRLYDGGARTALAWLHPERGTLQEFLRLPSGGDTSYPGLAWHRGRLWVSYYSSHEGQSAIYLARVQLPP